MRNKALYYYYKCAICGEATGGFSPLANIVHSGLHCCRSCIADDSKFDKFKVLLSAYRAKETKQGGPCFTCGEHCQSGDVCAACCEYAMEKDRERQKAKDELLETLARAIHWVVTNPHYREQIQAAYHKAFPEES